MSGSVELRPAKDPDRDAIAEIWHSSASLPGVGPANMPGLADLRARVDVELAADWVVTVAVRSEAVVGFVAIKPREAIIAEIFVRPGELGSGIGQALIAEAKRAMPGGFSLFTRTANSRARRFYERAGLQPLREGIHPRSGDPIVWYGWSPQA